MNGKTILGALIFAAALAYGAGCMLALSVHPNVWMLGGGLVLGALLIDTADVVAALKAGAEALKGFLPGKGGEA